MEQEVADVIGILKAQQHADSTVIACLLATVVSGQPLHEWWNRLSAASVVEEQMASNENKFVKNNLDDFTARIAYWSELIHGMGDNE